MPNPDPVLAALSAARDDLAAFLADQASVDRINRVGRLLATGFQAGHKVLICGNGGSACDAMHFAEEFTGRYRANRPPLPVIALADPGHITCTANDFGFEHIFARSVEAFARPGDVLVVLSTSGNSLNIVRAVEAAKARGATTIALLGRGGGQLAGLCDHQWIVPGKTSDRIQEIHMLVLHVLIEVVERILFPANYAAETGPARET
ncbi:MAG: SIS domain-containing protein [Phycisphaerales bacterium]|nr:SIS domain-containing protein [Phycisphaerales bacterium]